MGGADETLPSQVAVHELAGNGLFTLYVFEHGATPLLLRGTLAQHPVASMLMGIAAAWSEKVLHGPRWMTRCVQCQAPLRLGRHTVGIAVPNEMAPDKVQCFFGVCDACVSLEDQQKASTALLFHLRILFPGVRPVIVTHSTEGNA